METWTFCRAYTLLRSGTYNLFLNIGKSGIIYQNWLPHRCWGQSIRTQCRHPRVVCHRCCMMSASMISFPLLSWVDAKLQRGSVSNLFASLWLKKTFERLVYLIISTVLLSLCRWRLCHALFVIETSSVCRQRSFVLTIQETQVNMSTLMEVVSDCLTNTFICRGFFREGVAVTPVPLNIFSS